MALYLTKADMAFLQAGVKAAQRVENRYHDAVEAAFKALEDETLSAITKGKPVKQIDFEALLLRNMRDAMEAGFAGTPKVPTPSRLAAGSGPGPTIKIPSNPAELRKWWDQTRKGKAPRRIQVLADRIKDAYLAKVQELRNQYAAAFDAGQVFNQDQVKSMVRRSVAVGRKRANTIVGTETTRYYNQARRAYYDAEPTVTHYLYVAIRDKRTTKWCKEGIGRHGIVYKKGSAVLDRETPPTHYNCRSELLPLVRFNPVHKRYINDKSRWRENRSPAPLMAGWNTEKRIAEAARQGRSTK